MQNVALLINLGLAGTSLIVSVVCVHTSNLGGYSRAPDHCWLRHYAPTLSTAVLAFDLTCTTDELHERETHAKSKRTGRTGDEKACRIVVGTQEQRDHSGDRRTDIRLLLTRILRR